MKIKNMLKMLLLVLTMSSLFIACGKKSSNQMIQIKGSDTILNLTQKVTEDYLKANPKARISVTGGGSGTGIAAIINKTVDIAMSSRDIKESEMEDAKKQGLDLEEVTIAYDAISIVVNKNNGVENLTLKQLKDIYTGVTTNWKELGGADKKIVVLSRDSSSGTHVYFKEHVLREGNSKGTEEFATTVLFLPSNESIKKQINDVDGAIGYLGLGYVDDSVKLVQIEGVLATLDNVKNKTYPIARPVYWYVDKNMSEGIKALVDYMLSDKGQEAVVAEGFVPVK